MWLKWTPLHAAACAAAISLSVLAQLRVSADPPSSSRSVPSSESGALNSRQKSPASSKEKPQKAPKEKQKKAPDAQAKAGQASPQSGAAADRHATRGMYLARTALSYRGVPYRFGGRSARSGFDCSGLVQSVYAKWGLYLPRVARAQYKMGKRVKPKDLLPGDLVFFKNTYKRGISHVGIYIGDNFFIHASRPGVGVVVSRLDRGYHKRHWAGARRLDLSKLPPVPGEAQTTPQVVIQETPDAPAVAVPAPSSDPAPAR